MTLIFERIKKLCVEQLGVEAEEVVPTASFVDDLGSDSLDLVELIMSIEEEFSTPDKKIEIPDEDADKIITVQDIVDYLIDRGVPDNDLPDNQLNSLPQPSGRIYRPQASNVHTNQPESQFLSLEEIETLRSSSRDSAHLKQKMADSFKKEPHPNSHKGLAIGLVVFAAMVSGIVWLIRSVSPPASAFTTPTWVYVIIVLGAILVICVIILIVRTRRV